jgi:YD repeat-containing protein
MTDRDFDGFKGKVKFVESWSEETGSNKKTKDKPEISDDVAYDKAGNKLKYSFYYIGKRTTYFVLEGEKVSKSERFQAPSGEGLKMSTALGPGKPTRGDDRYETKFKYDYDKNGRIIEERRYSNDGSLERRISYSYSRDNRPLSETSYIDGPHYKETFAYNANGNLAEAIFISYDQNGKEASVLSSKYTNYKLDQKGNWIERREMKSHLGEREPSRIYIAHRNIIYY